LIFTKLNKHVIIALVVFICSCGDNFESKEEKNYSMIFSSRSSFSYDLWHYDESLKLSYPLTKNRWNEDSPKFYSDSSKILYVSDALGKKKIFSSDLTYHRHIKRFELSNKALLTNDFEYNVNPKISSSGSYVSFISSDTGNYEVFIFFNSTRKIINLSQSKYKDYNQQFTPDGLSVIFQSLRGKNNNEIILKSIDGSLAVNLSAHEGDDILAAHQSIANNGRFFVFSSNRDGDYDIYKMNLDGTNLIKLTHNNFDDFHPIIDPFGETICFVSDNGKNKDIYMMYSTGSSLKNISNSPANDSSPIYSNDGKYISFLSDRDENLEIYVFSISDKELINISNNIRGDFNQQFIPVNN